MPFFRDKDKDRLSRQAEMGLQAGLQASFRQDGWQAQQGAFAAERAPKIKKGVKTKNSKPSPFVLRNAIIGMGAATAVWGIIVIASFLATREFLAPLAIILGLAVIPIAITTGYTARS
jgi:ABC-type protease/lipase transport system fused ATPase/permease subunit